MLWLGRKTSCNTFLLARQPENVLVGDANDPLPVSACPEATTISDEGGQYLRCSPQSECCCRKTTGAADQAAKTWTTAEG